VNGSKESSYEVNLRKPSCTCPDWTDRAPRDGCKHILKIKIERGEVDKLSYQQGSDGTNSSKSYADNWRFLRERVLELDRWKCQKCLTKGKPVGTTELHVHHIIPKSQGGKDKISNLITLCHSCHEEIHGHKIPTGRYGSYSQGGSTDANKTIAKQNSPNYSSSNSNKQAGSTKISKDIQFSRTHNPMNPPWSEVNPEPWESDSLNTGETSPSYSDKNPSDTLSESESKNESSSSQSNSRSNRTNNQSESISNNNTTSVQKQTSPSMSNEAGQTQTNNFVKILNLLLQAIKSVILLSLIGLFLYLIWII
jgi:5-methylcytosine-specific restriction endonuclease McrA